MLTSQHGQGRSLRLSFRVPKEPSAHCHGGQVHHKQLEEGEAFLGIRAMTGSLDMVFSGAGHSKPCKHRIVKLGQRLSSRRNTESFHSQILRPPNITKASTLGQSGIWCPATITSGCITKRNNCAKLMSPKMMLRLAILGFVSSYSCPFRCFEEHAFVA